MIKLIKIYTSALILAGISLVGFLLIAIDISQISETEKGFLDNFPNALLMFTIASPATLLVSYILFVASKRKIRDSLLYLALALVSSVFFLLILWTLFK